MKKFFTLAAAVLASFSLWAAEPDFESYDWTEASIADVLGDHDGIVISASGLGSNGNVSGHWYMPNNQNLKNSDSSWKYFGVSSSTRIDSIAILYCPNGSNKTNIAWVAWGEGVTPNQYVLGHGETAGTTSSKAWDDAIWETIDLSSIEAYTVYTSRSIREFREIEATSNISNFGAGQTINILGIRVWLGGEVVTYNVTYKANYGEVADVVDDAAKKVGACPFVAPEGKKFTGWNTAADGTGTAYEVGAALKANVVLYAQWADVCYEAVYDFIGGVGSAEVTAADATVNEGVSLVMSNSAGRITITPTEGFTFQAGDIIEFAGTVGNASKPFGIKIGSDTYEAAEVIYNNPEVATEGGTASYSGVLKSNAETLVIGRDGGTTTTLNSLVIKRETICREVDHIDVTLGGVAVNGEALSDTQMATLYGALTLNLAAEYVEAPTVTFTVQTDTYYVGETEPSTKSEKIDVVAALNPDGKWQAQQTVGKQTYTITAVKPATVTITYMDGATVLGEETVKTGELSTKHAEFETKPLAKFEGWFKNSDFTSPIDIQTYAINEDQTLYGKFVKTYISANVNIEQFVLDYGTKADIKTVLTAAGWDFENLNSLDTLNDLENKPNRNEPYLGLKLKTAGAYLQGWIPVDGGVVIKFGNLGSDIKVTITGANTNLEQTFTAADLAETGNEFQIWGFTEDVLVKISTVSGGTVVLKQLMLINEGIQEVTLPAPGAYLITIAESENGTVTADWADKKYRTPVGATVTLTVTHAEGYKVGTVTVNEVALEAVEGVYSFVMPAQEVTVSATFVAENGTSITNTEAAVKAVKVVREGKLFIEKNGVLYNAQGNVVK